MKRRILAALLAAMLLLGGCGGKQNDAPARKADSDMIIITENYAEDGHYTDSLDNSWTYSYHVPQLTADTAGARAINAAIDEKFGDPVRGALKDMQQALSLGCVSVSWKSYRYEDVLSLVVKAEADWEFTDYAVYLYDAGRGVQLTTAELLEKLGVAQETFLDGLRRSAAAAFDEQGYINTTEGVQWVQERSWTVGAENVNTEAMVYADETGKLMAVLPVGSMAGAAWYYKVLEAMPERGGETLTVEAGDVALTVGGENAQLRLEGVEETYTVGGAWSDYTAGVCAALGEDGCVYIFLLTAGGTVEYINVTGGLAGGALCLSPLGGIGGVTALETDEEQQTVLALDGEGKRHDLKPLVEAMTAKMPSALVGDWHMTLLHNSVEEDCWIEVAEDGAAVWQEGVPDSASCRVLRGSAQYLGMTAEGIVMYYEMTNEADENAVLRGTMAVRCDWDGNGLLQLGGDALLDVSGYVWPERVVG